MKKIILSMLTLATLSSCNLDLYPLDEISPETFFNTESDLILYTNSFYDNILPEGTAIFAEQQDNIIVANLSDEMKGTRTVPTTGGGWVWTSLRNINFFLESSSKFENESIRNQYDGLARFFRAVFYYDMVVLFGDVPWYDSVISDSDEEMLTKARDSRSYVMEKIMEDIDFAIEYLPTSVSVNEINKWTALAYKARICLFEGTFRKYHSEFALADSDSYLTKAAAAALEVINGGQYSLYSTGNPDNDYLDLFASIDAKEDEVILARAYSLEQQVYHNLNYYTTTASNGRPGLDKSLVNSYLMKDGSRFTDISGYETMEYYEEMQDRDPRLTQTVRGPGYTRIGNSVTLVPEFGSSVTGYQMIKMVMDESGDTTSKSYNDLPIFRYAEVLLIYAEAKAELGTISQSDLDISINILKDRVAMPHINLVAANSDPDEVFAELNPNVSGSNKGIILEIRRERRLEMVMEGYRWNDILRWKDGKTVERPFIGMYFPAPGVYDLDNDGVDDVCLYEGDMPSYGNLQYMKLGSDVVLTEGTSGNVIVNSTVAKSWTESRDYLYPIPIQERQLNQNLTQNPGWVDGLTY